MRKAVVVSVLKTLSSKEVEPRDLIDNSSLQTLITGRFVGSNDGYDEEDVSSDDEIVTCEC